jgi:hypothetical protein
MSPPGAAQGGNDSEMGICVHLIFVARPPLSTGVGRAVPGVSRVMGGCRGVPQKVVLNSAYNRPCREMTPDAPWCHGELGSGMGYAIEPSPVKSPGVV